MQQSREQASRTWRRRIAVRRRSSVGFSVATLSYTSLFLVHPSIWAWMLSSPHIEIRQSLVLWPRHLVWCTEHARPRYGSTSVYTTHGSARLGSGWPVKMWRARPARLAFTRLLQTKPTRASTAPVTSARVNGV